MIEIYVAEINDPFNKLEIRVSQNLAKLGGGCTASGNFSGVLICV